MIAKKLALLFVCVASFLIASSDTELAKRHALTYDEGGGRFGDRILVYAQARYLSFLTEIPFLYRPFIYSDQLIIEHNAEPYDKYAQRFKNKFHINSAGTFSEFLCLIRNPNIPPTLFVVDYFPSDIFEWNMDSTRSIALEIPWHEQQFAQYLKSSLSPRIPIPELRKPGRLNVADHVRALSGDDTPETSIRYLPLKVPTFEYHKRQIRKVYNWNLKKPMHVFVFTDSKNPQHILQEFRKSFRHEDITFDVHIRSNVDTDYPVEDFFAMQQFDVLIATQSNFSMMASRLKKFDMLIFPVHVSGQYPNWVLDRIQVITKKSDWFPYEINTTLKE
jgi:hypothetical protein